jgi:2',3'-cyclic-nucleotide 2'-phosphodiesterase (5'-nucleotidase family)
MRYLLTTLILLALSCGTNKKNTNSAQDDGMIEIVFLQMNDVYEIAPLSDGTGGLARVATLRKQLLAKNPNTYTILAGDFISPSVIGTLKHEGKRIQGRQMVETLNAVGIDWVVFGNHEFDYDDYNVLQARLDESRFTWLGANARLRLDTMPAATPFFKNKNGQKEICPDELSLLVKDADGTIVRLGLFGVLLDTGKKPWVQYGDWFAAAQNSYKKLKDQKADLCVGLTHLVADDDIKLAGLLPNVPLLMGGHDHNNQRHVVGKSVVAKADANAKTVYIHTLRYDKRKKTTNLTSELRTIDASIPEDALTAGTVSKWNQIMENALSSSGFNSKSPVVQLEKELDCTESTLRYKQAEAGTIINEAMVAVAKYKPECSMFNSGSVRIDDKLTGILTEIDIVRMLPFGGGLSEAEMKGSILTKTLEVHEQNMGRGGYLQLWSIHKINGAWCVNGKAIVPQQTYRVMLPDFLLTGSEQGMSFLKTKITDAKTGATDNPEIPIVRRPTGESKSDLRGDIRHALIAYWRKE